MKIQYSPGLGCMILLGEPHEFAQLRSKLMKPTSGFLTDDGNFFETDVEANYHEAETRLKEALVLGSDFDDATFIVTLENLAPQIKEYLDAYAAKSALNQANVTAPKDGTETFLAQSFGSSGTVSDVGSSERPTAVPEGSTGDGVGSGGYDASGFRGRPDLATPTQAASDKARRSDRAALIRSGALDPFKEIPEQKDEGR